MAKKPHTVTVEDLRKAFSSRKLLQQFDAFYCYSKQRPSIEALPFLRRALRSKDWSVIKSAAISLQKLGKEALPAVQELINAAYAVDKFDLPQAYPVCLPALVTIDPTNEEILHLVTHWVGLHNWMVTSTAMKALQKIGTPEATALLKRIHDFWYSEWSKRERELAAKFLKPLK